MTKRYALAMLLSLTVLLQVPRTAPAQSFELGFQFSALRQNNSVFFSTPQVIWETRPYIGRSAPGVGGRAAYNLGDHWSIESEINVFPRDNAINGRTLQGLFGTKAGLRGKRVGIFGKVRPGFLHMTRSLSDCGVGRGVGASCVFDGTRTDVALDLGAVLELYTSRRWYMRVDLGDTVQFFRGNKDVGFFFFTPIEPINTQAVKIAQSSQDPFDKRAHTFHNVQFGFGVGFRF
jgi:hypothetical protein